MGRLHIIDCPSSNDISNFFNFILEFDDWVWFIALTAADIVMKDITLEPLGIIQCYVVVYLGNIGIHWDVA